MEEPAETEVKKMLTKLNVHQVEKLKKELVALKERLGHMKVSVFGENQSEIGLTRYLHKQFQYARSSGIRCILEGLSS